MSKILFVIFVLTIFHCISSIDIESLPNTYEYCKYSNGSNITTYEDCVKLQVGDKISCCFIEANNSKKACIKLNQAKNTLNTLKKEIDSIVESKTTNFRCSVETKSISNNCGVAGIYEPLSRDYCSNATIPESFCCMVKHSDGVSCRRLDKYINDDDEPKKYSDLSKEIKDINPNVAITAVLCSQRFIHYATFLFVFTLIVVVL